MFEPISVALKVIKDPRGMATEIRAIFEEHGNKIIPDAAILIADVGLK